MQESTKPDEGTIGTKNFIQGFINLYLTNKKYFLWLLNYLAKLLAQILQNKSKKACSLTQDEGQRLLLRERRLSIEEREVKLERERIEPMKLKKELNIN